MIDIRKLKELVKLMVENDLSELDLRDEQETVVVKRGIAPGIAAHAPVAYAMPTAAAAGPARSIGGPDDGPAQPEEEAGLVAITSPMVGTFYAQPDPESAPFVSIGAGVGPDTVVCIVEAMKVFSEIKAECTGTLVKVLVNNGEAVEYGQKLFLVRPA